MKPQLKTKYLNKLALLSFTCLTLLFSTYALAKRDSKEWTVLDQVVASTSSYTEKLKFVGTCFNQIYNVNSYNRIKKCFNYQFKIKKTTGNNSESEVTKEERLCTDTEDFSTYSYNATIDSEKSKVVSDECEFERYKLLSLCRLVAINEVELENCGK